MVQIAAESLIVGPTVWTPLVLLICGYIGSWLFRSKKQQLDVPEIDCRGLTGTRNKLQECFERYAKKNEVYKLRMTHHDIVMLPPKFMTDIKSLPEEKVSFSGEVYARFNGILTGLGDGGIQDALVHTVARDLTHHTGSVIADIINECNEYTIPHELGTSTEWTTIPCFGKGLRIVALLTSRIFIGLPACRDEEWITVIINHTRKLFDASMELWKYPRLIRGFVAPFCKGIRELRADLKVVESFVRPRIEERMKLIKNLQPGEAPPDDILQWIMKNAPDKAEDVEWHAKQQLGLAVASIHTTGMLLTQCMFDLAAYPEYQQILRDELHEVLEKQGTHVIRKQTMTKLKKLDSFIREVQRFAPSSLTSVDRLIIAPEGITLSNGLHLPYKTFIAAPSAQVAMDGSLWENPTQFDGLRFYKLRQIPGNDHKYQLVSSNAENILFGQGIHACPGRFFASNEIKLVIMCLLLNYDMKLEDGVSRPPNMELGTAVSPCPSTNVMIRKRKNDIKLLEADGE